MKTYAYGFPRLGKNREFKKSIEAFWNGKINSSQLTAALKKIAEHNLNLYASAIDEYPHNEISAYDQMLDTAIKLGLYDPQDLNEYYELCRGDNPLEMTKWFNTNYHYLVTDFTKVDYNRIHDNSENPVLSSLMTSNTNSSIIGPFTFIRLSKNLPKEIEKLTEKLAAAYYSILSRYESVFIEEPAFATDVTATEEEMIKDIYSKILRAECNVKLITYYDSIDILPTLYKLPFSGIGLDFVNGKRNLEMVQKHGFPANMELLAGVINGRNVWKCDYKQIDHVLSELGKHSQRLIVSNAAPLFHLPYSLEDEDICPEELIESLSFAKEKLQEIANAANLPNLTVSEEKRVIPGENKDVRERVQNLRSSDFVKSISAAERKSLQKEALDLPLLATTTIGSFPQTADVRKNRAAFHRGELSRNDYETFIREKISDLIAYQEDAGLDVFVHGEFERTDMVEHFASKLEGITSTKNGWVLSYGTRTYRPPIIYGDISRKEPMTISEIEYAQRLTKKPVKGMLTGPVTIIAWSFPRIDIPVEETAYQIGLALQDEIRDYEQAGIKIVQVDEAAFREKAPLKRDDWDEYFNWAVKSFNLSTLAKPETQIHTHMCYSEFNEIIDHINKMDFDVITIEATRSKGDVIEAFNDIDFKKQIGLGVWDIHSPAVPTEKDIEAIVERCLKVFPKESFWINPDCGLKTRGWEETKASIKNMVSVAQKMR